MKTPYLQRINGVWRVRIVVPPPLVPIVGKPVLLRSTGTHDKRKASMLAAPVIAEFGAKIIDAERQLYGDYPDFLDNLLSREDLEGCHVVVDFGELVDLWASRRDHTTRKAKRAMEGKIKRLTEFLGHMDAALVTADDLTRYLRTLVASGLKPNTVEDHIAYLRRIFGLAAAAEWIIPNPAEHLRRAWRTGKIERGGAVDGLGTPCLSGAASAPELPSEGLRVRVSSAGTTGSRQRGSATANHQTATVEGQQSRGRARKRT